MNAEQNSLSHVRDLAAPSQQDPHPLDAVIWNALTGRQRSVARGDQWAQRYVPTIAPFAAIAGIDAISFASLLTLVSRDEPTALFTMERIDPPAAFSVVRRDIVDQMIWNRPVGALVPSAALSILGADDVPAMTALAARTQPGPFGPRTIELGRYLGVRSGATLVAMAGERMQIDGHTEISGVCVDDDHRGRGHAVDLVTALVWSITARNETPFLHVFGTNQAAIALYRKLGFTLRRRLHLTVVVRAEDAVVTEDAEIARATKRP